MLYFRRRRYQHVWAGIGRAYYGSLASRPPRRHLRNDSHNANIDPTSPSTKSFAHVNRRDAKGRWQDLIRTTPPPPIDLSRKIGKVPRRYLNLISLLPPEGRQGEHDSDQQDSTPRKAGEGSSVLADTQEKRGSSVFDGVSRDFHAPRLSTGDSLIHVRTNWTAMRRATPSKTLRPPLRGHKHKTINPNIKLEKFMSKEDIQERPEIGSSSSDLSGQGTHLDPIIHDMSPPTPIQSQSTDKIVPAVTEIPMPLMRRRRRGRGSRSFVGPSTTTPVMDETDKKRLSQHYMDYGPATATPAVDEIDRKRLAEQAMDYGPTFAPYTTKLLKRTEGWEERPALWDISPGCLLWLPPYYKNPEDTNLLHPHPNSVDHPIVVLSVDVSGPEDAIVTFMTIRSFKSFGAKTSLLNFWKKYLPLSRFPRENWRDEPEARESWKDALLFRENYTGRKTNRVQYVDIQNISTARWEDLRCYQGERRVIGIPQRLCEESMARLRAARTWWEGQWDTNRGLVKWEDEWVPSGKMRDVFRQRYIEPLGEEDNELGSVVTGKVANDASGGSGELALQMKEVRAEMRAEFEEARKKMRAELEKVRTEMRSELMTRMIEELEDVREGLQVVNRAEKAVVELELAKSARPPMPPPEYATSPQLAVWHAANDMPEWSGDLTNKAEAMRLELKMARMEVDGVRAEMERMRGDMDKMKVDLALLKRADAAREAAGRRKSVKVPDVGMYAPALGPRSPASRAALPPGAAGDVLEGTGESTLKGLNKELKQAMSATAQAAQTPAPNPAASLLPQVAGKGPRLGPLAQSRG
ncbi:hypothetical protein VE01_09813 [Pseudogymnoascus verrucosus]|uniref:Uncharacterized protein n=1 Tax=Pseudogymnoascus verrucosus TaxID=342668 RepID=A0A1B8G9Y7_9PEZI|nr:uncharacterized protein VE01_09813 [Pseudogymnoascus verrucosus]OBT92631.1 hypothetical protein VE01_09813 [Pseudogymnoascus verrucosus]